VHPQTTGGVPNTGFLSTGPSEIPSVTTSQVAVTTSKVGSETPDATTQISTNTTRSNSTAVTESAAPTLAPSGGYLNPGTTSKAAAVGNNHAQERAGSIFAAINLLVLSLGLLRLF
jgi:hypothetical protein